VSSMTHEALSVLRAEIAPVRLMVTAPVVGWDSVKKACDLAQSADFLLLDSAHPATGMVGATGLVHDWSLSQQIVASADARVILAEGLGPDSVGDAIQAVGPFGVDSETKTSRAGDGSRPNLADVQGLRLRGMYCPVAGEFLVLLEQAKAGDERAFTVLFHDLNPPLLRYLRVVAPSSAEDLAAETWLDVVRGLERFSGNKEGYRAWVLTIARNRHIDRLRFQGRRPLEVPAGELPPEPRDACDAADRDVEEDLSTEAALRLIATLPALQAEAVVLRSVVGLGAGEVARVLGRTPGAVRVALHRGLRRLAEELARAESDGAVKR
jgi:RNA polymerase sigma-70 factor (ECF subfamily)